jgi:glycosyltransferase involved in cell wall biosynthesis
VKITLFKTFDDPYRESMTQYASCLERALRKILGPEESVTGFFPAFAVKSPKSARYFSQYLLYPFVASLAQTDVNHVIDHSYAHLVHALDASRTVVTLHDMIWARVRRGEYHAASQKLNAVQAHNLSGLRKAAAVVCDSEASKKALLEFLPEVENRVRVIAPGLNDVFNHPKPVPFHDLLRGIPKPFLFHPGHTQSYKNIPALFYVLAEIGKAGHSVHLVKTGTEFTPEQISLAERLGVKLRVHHLGKVPQETLPEIYKAADALLLPSLDEGFGFPALEAMASGLPVVASNRGSLPELIRDAGILTEPEDYQGMALAVLSLIRTPSIRREFIARGKQRAADYTWENSAKKLLHLYHEIDSKKRKRP